MPPVCCVPLCRNRSQRSFRNGGKNLQFHRLPRVEPLRGEWCRSIGLEDTGQTDVRVCSEHFNGNRDYRRIASIIRDAGQTMKGARLKPDAVPSLQLPPTAKRHPSPAKDPTSKRQESVGVQPIEELVSFEWKAPREHSCRCCQQPPIRDAALHAADPQAKPAPERTWRSPPVTKERSVRTDPWLGKHSVATQVNFNIKSMTSHHAQTEALEPPSGSSATASSTTTGTSPVPVQAHAPSPDPSYWDDDYEEEEEEEEEEEGVDDKKDPLYEPFTRKGFGKYR